MPKPKDKPFAIKPLKPGERRPHPTLPNVTLTGPDPIDDYELPDDTSNRSRFKYIGFGIPPSREERLKWERAEFVVVDNARITLTLTDGRSLVLPLDWSARLPHGRQAERNTWKLLMDGIAVRWPLLGEIVSIKEALAGRKPEEDPATLKQWIMDRPKAAVPAKPEKQPASRRKAS